jgi:predicted nucleic acid-binding protein
MALTEYMNVLTINGIEVGVKELSVKKGLSYYDASYVSVSKNQSFALVTDDERLSKIALQYVKVLSSNNA